MIKMTKLEHFYIFLHIASLLGLLYYKAFEVFFFWLIFCINNIIVFEVLKINGTFIEFDKYLDATVFRVFRRPVG